MSLNRPHLDGSNLKKIAVIGGTGFIGYHIVKDLLQHNCKVTVVTRNLPRDMPVEWKGNVTFAKLDAQKAAAEEFKTILTGHQGLVYAAGGIPGIKNLEKKMLMQSGR